MSKIVCTINHVVSQSIPDKSKRQGNLCSHRAAEKAGHDDYEQGLTDMVFKDGGLPPFWRTNAATPIRSVQPFQRNPHLCALCYQRMKCHVATPRSYVQLVCGPAQIQNGRIWISVAVRHT